MDPTRNRCILIKHDVIVWGLDNTIQYNTQTHTEHLLSILPHPPTHPQPLAASTSQAGTAPSGPTAQQAPSAARWTSRSTDQEPWYEASKMDSYFKLATSLVLWISLPAAQDNIIYCVASLFYPDSSYTHTHRHIFLSWQAVHFFHSINTITPICIHVCTFMCTLAPTFWSFSYK